MKITKKQLKELILQELKTTVAFPDQEYQYIIHSRVGPFTSLVTTASDTLKRLEDSIRDSENLEDMDLESLKNDHLQRLRDKIGFIESVIDAKLDGKAQNTEGYE
jgi:hypothetical protein